MQFCKQQAARRQKRPQRTHFSWALLPAFFLTGCHPPVQGSSDVAITCRVTPSPPKVGLAAVFLTLTEKKTGRPISNAQVSVEGDMSHAGMKPVFGQAKEVGSGRYQAPLEFTMAGDWVLVVTAKLPDHRHIEQQIPVKNVGVH